MWLIGRCISFVHTLEKPTSGLKKEYKATKKEWTDTAEVIWSAITSLCGFSDGSCGRGTCGAGKMIQVTKTLCYNS